MDPQFTFARISLTKVRGSAPRSTGTQMLVTKDDILGSIGGGALEFDCINQARKGLGDQAGETIKFEQALGPNLGQCCGGSVQVVIDFHAQKPAVFGNENSHISLFGAGHVGQALMKVLAPLPFDVDWIDSRPDTQATLQLPNPQDWIKPAPPNSFVVVMTHSHAMDLDICFAALNRGCFPYVGLIGSETKRARFTSRLTQAGLTAQAISGLICPVGVNGLRSKHPSAIAVSVATQLMMKHEQLMGNFG